MSRVQILIWCIALASASRLVRRELQVTESPDPEGLNVIYYQTKVTCDNGEQKISQPCNGGTRTGCSYDACLQHCFDEAACKFFFHITSTSGCILYNSCEETRIPAYSGTTVEITRSASPSNSPSYVPTSAPTLAEHGLNVIYYQTKTTCFNGDQKISQPCNGGKGTGCSYDACMQHCFDEAECKFFFHITSTSGCILYNSCDETRTPVYSGTTVEVADLNVVYYQTTETCFNGEQKISQPCNGGTGTGCSYDACMQHCFDEDDCKFFFHITSTSGCILYNSCEETRTPAYSGTTVEIMRSASPSNSPSYIPTQAPTLTEHGLNVIYYQTKTTCFNGDQKISQPCNGGKGTGCSYDACMQHCFDDAECKFFFHITSTSGCILYNSCDETRTPAYSGTTVEVADLNVVYYQTQLTCFNGEQKISQPCDGGAVTGCSYDACMQHCFDEDDCKFFFHLTSTSGCILYNSCDETRTPAYSGTTVEIIRGEPLRRALTMAEKDFDVIYYQTKTTCFNGDQKISQPCNGGTGTGCSYDTCMHHCFDEDNCRFFFHITSTSGCTLYNSCDETRTPAYSGTTVEVTRPSAAPTQAPTDVNVVYYETELTCSNGDQKISQPCNGGKGTGCSYDACMQHCFDEPNCKFFFHITSTSGCILYNSCDETRTPAYSGTTVEITWN